MVKCWSEASRCLHRFHDTSQKIGLTWVLEIINVSYGYLAEIIRASDDPFILNLGFSPKHVSDVTVKQLRRKRLHPIEGPLGTEKRLRIADRCSKQTHTPKEPTTLIKQNVVPTFTQRITIDKTPVFPIGDFLSAQFSRFRRPFYLHFGDFKLIESSLSYKQFRQIYRNSSDFSKMSDQNRHYLCER